MTPRLLVEAAIAAALALLVARTWRRPRPSPRPPTRMTEAQALEAARGAVGEAAWSFAPLRVTAVRPGGDGAVWRLDQRVRGAGRFVEVDDATGAVTRQGGWGSR